MGVLVIVEEGSQGPAVIDAGRRTAAGGDGIVKIVAALAGRTQASSEAVEVAGRLGGQSAESRHRIDLEVAGLNMDLYLVVPGYLGEEGNSVGCSLE